MKYFSEILNKSFDTEKECIKAEHDYKKQIELEKKNKAEKEETSKKEKKALATAVAEATKKLDTAYTNYETAKKKAQEILEKSNQEVLDILNPAEEEIKKAKKAKYEAIARYNSKYGIYTEYLDDDKALRELRQGYSFIDDLMSLLFK